MQAMNLPDFFEKYPDEATCIEGFKAKRPKILAVGKHQTLL